MICVICRWRKLLKRPSPRGEEGLSRVLQDLQTTSEVLSVSLQRSANRVWEQIRPAHPTDLDFEVNVNSDYHLAIMKPCILLFTCILWWICTLAYKLWAIYHGHRYVWYVCVSDVGLETCFGWSRSRSRASKSRSRTSRSRLSTYSRPVETMENQITVESLECAY